MEYKVQIQKKGGGRLRLGWHKFESLNVLRLLRIKNIDEDNTIFLKKAITLKYSVQIIK